MAETTLASTRSSTTLTFDAANRVVAAAVTQANTMGKPMSIAVVDPAGRLVCFVRMDGAPLLSIDVATDKAYTAAGFGMPTHAWYDFIKDDAPLNAGALNIARLIVFGGGYPITVDDAIVGAIGVSGGHYSDDMQVAEAGLAAL